MPLDTAEVDLDPEEVLSENEERAHRPVFRDANNFPIGFFFHKSVTEPSRRALKRDIEKHGGIVLNTDKGADTVLISPLYERRMLQNAYNAIDDPSLRKVYVEYTPFIQHCIREKEFYHRPDITGMSGVPAGRRRNEYTAEDDERLCQYLSRILPDKESGGRQGLKVYQALLEAANQMPKEYSWAKRHTPESWKERYKKNASNFDAWIAEMVKIDPPSKKQLWHEDRRKTHNANKRRRQYVYTDEEEEEDLQREQSVQSEEEERNQTDEEDYVPPARKRRRSENVPHRAQPRAKRPRIARQSDYQDSPPRRSRKSMGKERALEQGEDQEVEEELSYEGNDDNGYVSLHFDEPGPSGLRSPERTLAVSVHTHRSGPMSPSFFATQETLVDAASHGETSKDISNSRDLPRRSDHLSQQRGQKVAQTPEPASSSPVRWPRTIPFVDLTLRPRASQGSQLSQGQPTPHKSPVNASQPTPPPPGQPSNTFQRPRKAARRPPEMMAATLDETAPYKNTRLRSRSIEPSTPHIQKIPKPRRETRKQETIPEKEEQEPQKNAPYRNTRSSSRLRSVEPVAPLTSSRWTSRKKKQDAIPEEESADEREPVVAEVRAPITETLVEEMDVAILLTADSLDLDRSTMRPATRRRDISMDTDDAQIAQNLRPGSVSSRVGLPAGFSSLFRRPSDVLKDLSPPSSKRYSLPAKPPTQALNRPTPLFRPAPRGPRQSEPSNLRNEILGTFKTPDPHTPAQRMRKDSISSADSFPISGTRASALKKSLQHREKLTPYKPPQGTRAAQLAMSK